MQHPFMICSGFVRIATSPEMTRNDVTGSREPETGNEREI